MSIKVTFPKTDSSSAGALILGVFEKEDLGSEGKKADKAMKGLIVSTLSKAKNFEGKAGQTLTIYGAADAKYDLVIVLGLGKANALVPIKAEEAGGKLLSAITAAGLKAASLVCEKTKHMKPEDLYAHIAAGLCLRGYNFEEYKSKDKKKAAPEFKTLKILAPHPANTKAKFNTLMATIEGTFFARDLVNTAPNDLYPDSYAKRIKAELKPLGVDVEIIDDKKLKKMGAGGITAVGQGSDQKPRMVILKWNGLSAAKSAKAKPLGFVGKGVTFDTGGISLKPGSGMDEMKMDMGGSAAVVGLMKTLALRKAKVNVVGIVGLAENMPSSNAYRPGDVLTSYSGKTIEVLNTDAEGRLVLADCLTYMQKHIKPEFIIDLATLTGAIMVALGHEYSGVFSNDNDIWANLEKASARTGEKLWRMPLDKAWNQEMESGVADIRNIGKSRYGGACTAAAFLEFFVDKDMKWAHMDIAGTAWTKTDRATGPKYGTGFGVRVLNDFIAEHYE